MDAEGHREADLPQGAGGAASDAREGHAGSKSLQRHVEEAEGLHREHVEAGTAPGAGLAHQAAIDSDLDGVGVGA